MIKLIDNKVYFHNGGLVSASEARLFAGEDFNFQKAYQGTIAYSILNAHNKKGSTQRSEVIGVRFDALASHDITYVGVVQTAKASGLEYFSLPYVLTNCHNSLCAVGGTINEDDHMFGLSAAKKYGGIYVPANMAVIHTYMRERMAGCGKMILGSDSHTRYGAIGTLAIGEGGPELVKQLLGRTYDTLYPKVIAVELKGEVRRGVGPQDVALAIIGAVFSNGFAKNSVLEFVGGGIEKLPMEYRNGIDVMTTETACLSSIWTTDEKTREYLKVLGRESDYKRLQPADFAEYDSAIIVDLGKIEPMIALPFHPSNVYKLSELIQNPMDILTEVESEGRRILGKENLKFSLTDKLVDGKILVGQGVIGGCAGGTYDNIAAASKILCKKSVGNGKFSLNIYPSSQPVQLSLMRNGLLEPLVAAGAVLKPAFCGPCFGAGDVPANNALSIRHNTRNFESREGSKPSDGQIASVALMDSRSIAVTAANGGVLTSALGLDYSEDFPEFKYDDVIYKNRVYNGFNNPKPETELTYGPNIADWPKIEPLQDNLLLKISAAIFDEVTTTDELIPSGETSSYRSNPQKLAEFALSRKRPDYVMRAKAVAADAEKIAASGLFGDYERAVNAAGLKGLKAAGKTALGSAVYALKPGDGSAREQAASVQRVLGGAADIAREYATKRYRSNLINWGIIPFLSDFGFKDDDIIFVPDVKAKLINGDTEFDAAVYRNGEIALVKLSTGQLSAEERDIIVKGCLINFYQSSR